MRLFLLVLIFLVALAGFLAAGAPMSLALRAAQARERGLDYADASGTIWRGVARDVRVAGQAVGDVELTVDPWALLRGQVAVEFASRGVVRADGAARLSADGTLRLSRATFVADARDLTRLHPEISARGGEMFVRVEEATFARDGTCRDAAGVVQSDVLARGGEAAQWRGPALDGRIACENGALAVDLSGAEGGTDVRVAATLSAITGARVVADVSTSSPEVEAALAYFGFEEAGDGFRYAYVSGSGTAP